MVVKAELSLFFAVVLVVFVVLVVLVVLDCFCGDGNGYVAPTTDTLSSASAMQALMAGNP